VQTWITNKRKALLADVEKISDLLGLDWRNIRDYKRGIPKCATGGRFVQRSLKLLPKVPERGQS